MALFFFFFILRQISLKCFSTLGRKKAGKCILFVDWTIWMKQYSVSLYSSLFLLSTFCIVPSRLNEFHLRRNNLRFSAPPLLQLLCALCISVATYTPLQCLYLRPQALSADGHGYTLSCSHRDHYQPQPLPTYFPEILAPARATLSMTTSAIQPSKNTDSSIPLLPTPSPAPRQFVALRPCEVGQAMLLHYTTGRCQGIRTAGNNSSMSMESGYARTQ